MMATTYIRQNVRNLLREGFDDRELRRFCFDLSTFRPVYDQLSQETGKDDIIDLLLQYAFQKNLVENLLLWAKEQNPAKYEKNQPYQKPVEIKKGDLIGTTLGGKYELIERLGQGGMAAVYKAYQPQLDRFVAVKVIRPEKANDPDFIERFEREAKAAARLKHPHIVPIHDFAIEGDLYYLVMELIDGPTLEDELKVNASLIPLLPLTEIWRIFNDLANAVAYAHAKGVIHRDLKPANIMLTADTRRIFLTDFGIARFTDPTAYSVTAAMVGTAEYMSPEQAKGEPVDARSDIYALGVILYRLVTGKLPFLAENPVAVVFKHINEAPPRPRNINPNLRPEVEQFILKALNKSPADRYQTVGEMVQAMAQALMPKPDDQTTRPAEILPIPANALPTMPNKAENQPAEPPADKPPPAPTPPIIPKKAEKQPDGEPSPAPAKQAPVKPTIGLITALPKEYVAVKALLENQLEMIMPGQGAGRRYLLGQIPAGSGGKHTVVLLLADVGNNIAAARATLLLEHFSTVKSIIMVGIAGGAPYPQKPADHVRLGDVVVSNQGGVIQYDFDQETTAGVINRVPPRPPSASLIEAVRLLEVAEIEGRRPWLKYLDRVKAVRPPAASDILYNSTDPTQPIPHPPDSQREPGRPRIFTGPIASANKLLKNPLKRDELRDRFGVKAVEMEGSGIADAAWQHEVGYLVVRGICDYCDIHKGDDWQAYAAFAAAAYTRALIESIPAQPTKPDESNRIWGILAGIVSFLLFIGVIALIWLALNPSSVKAMRRPPDGPLNAIAPPSPMPGGFNIAVAEFGITGQAAENFLAKTGWEVSDWLARGIEADRALHPDIMVNELWGPDEMGVVPGENREDRAAHAERLADKYHINILIYGVITGNQNNYFVEPEFFVAWEGFDYASEVAGPDQLGRQVPIQLPFENPDKNNLNNELKARRRVLQYVVYGLGYLYYTNDNNQNYLEAFEEFDDASNESAGNLEVVHLLKGAAQLLYADDLKANPTQRAETLNTAAKSFSRAHQLNPDYARSYLGLGSVVLQQAITYNLTGTDIITANNTRLLEARDWYSASLRADDQPTLAYYIPIKAYYGLGQVNLAGYKFNLPGWSDAEARRSFNQVIITWHKEANQASDLTWFVGNAHFNLGLLAGWVEDWDAVIVECNESQRILNQIEINRPLEPITYCYEGLGLAYEKKGKLTEACDAYSQAIQMVGRINMPADDQQRWQTNLDRLKEKGVCS